MREAGRMQGPPERGSAWTWSRRPSGRMWLARRAPCCSRGSLSAVPSDRPGPAVPGHRQACEELEEIQRIAGGRPGPGDAGWRRSARPRTAGCPSRSASIAPTSRSPPAPSRWPNGSTRLAESRPRSRSRARPSRSRTPVRGPSVRVGGHQDLPVSLGFRLESGDRHVRHIGRLAAWYRRAAAGRLVEAGQPLHPPLAYRLFGGADCVVIRPDLPRDFRAAAAVMVCGYPARRRREWLRPAALDLDRRPALRPARCRSWPTWPGARRARASWGQSDDPARTVKLRVSRLLPRTARRAVRRARTAADLLEHLARRSGSRTCSPQCDGHAGAAARRPRRTDARIPGADRPGMHLEVWQLDPPEAAVLRIASERGAPAEPPGRGFPAAEGAVGCAPRSLSWAYVEESRLQIVTRRDTAKTRPVAARQERSRRWAAGRSGPGSPSTACGRA